MRMNRAGWSLVGIVCIAWLTAAPPVQAHHAFAAEFDASRPVTVKGTVVKVIWTNPHSWIHLDVRTPDGKVERWMFEGGPPGALVRRGIVGKNFLDGQEIVINGFMARG